jgi:hypothetical protein
MTKTSVSLIELIEELARLLSIELDLQYEDLDPSLHAEDLRALTAAACLLQKNGIKLPEALHIVLARAAGKPLRVL